MADIAVSQIDPSIEHATPDMPIWAALMGLAALAGVVWMLFSMGTGGVAAPASDPVPAVVIDNTAEA